MLLDKTRTSAVKKTFHDKEAMNTEKPPRNLELDDDIERGWWCKECVDVWRVGLSLYIIFSINRIYYAIYYALFSICVSTEESGDVDESVFLNPPSLVEAATAAGAHCMLNNRGKISAFKIKRWLTVMLCIILNIITGIYIL